MSATYFISDLHLSDDEPEQTEKFVQFIKANQTADGIYILGDLFEYWIGQDLAPRCAQTVIDTLAACQCPTYLMVGNRDFLLEDKFYQQAKTNKLTDPTVIDLYGQSVLLLHGDTLCSDDKSYQRFRKVARLRWLQWLFLKTSKTFRKNLADDLRKKSQSINQHKSYAMMDATRTAVLKTFKKYQTRAMIHGHTHKPAVHNYQIQEQKHQRYVLGAWEDKAEVLVWTAEHIKLISLSEA